jgi:transcriptional regulator GlxA family with amidase domain
MAVIKRDSFPAARNASHRRIIAVVVPPIDELDLVGPLQVLNSANRLAGRKIYAVEVVNERKTPNPPGRGRCLDLHG